GAPGRHRLRAMTRRGRRADFGRVLLLRRHDRPPPRRPPAREGLRSISLPREDAPRARLKDVRATSRGQAHGGARGTKKRSATSTGGPELSYHEGRREG